ncbi:MAG: folylpolyglutamate synthase/dihydrofolate synthase family protein [Candidatus Bipolaricaulota bacterium]|nr:bifunctional folylpolyglutamate synthase/dihydrofolate synthase [Candidatus Bipolaricaulota bacterium]MDW8110588.1 folylpolyglutamate synthase/dihydrofolate synthase family protein [Candidatus Bipolaricaulota bacterium]MDW8329500.1 folylpolyglutamate synthase/dihydrofolate synthase family protein [Candidatus Bipolaricaulota bacterium]
MDQAISYLKRLPFAEVKPGLGRVLALLEAVGHPQRSLPTVHITGTNGKGSVAAMIASVLRSAGYRTGLYTSPHLISYRERMRIYHPSISLFKEEGEREGWISEDDFCALVDELMPIAESLADRPTQFEFLTAMAFLYFARQRVDIAVIEVGMGGRFDATNVVMPLVSVLTNVELDHTEFLGPTIEKIAWEKAGIAKPNVPFVTGERKPEALSVIERECAAVGAPLVLAKRAIERLDFTWEYQEFQIESLGRVKLQLLGGYQRENLRVAVEALRVLQERLVLSETAIRTGLERARWPGRFEVVQIEPSVIVLDGAHNPHAIRALRDDLRRYIQKYQITKKLLLFGVLHDKDYPSMAQTLFSEFDEIVLVRPESPRALDPTALLRWAPRARIASDVATALEMAHAAKPELLCVTGSLYLVGAVKRLLL